MKKLLILCALIAVGRASAQLLVETEAFADKGGWVADHQAFEQIRSAYLMAHGLGRPVADAETVVQVPEAGDYHLYVSTYNWTSPWYEGKGPGAFQVVVDGTPLPAELGTTGSGWEWQYAGAVRLAKGDVRLALHDLTGFNGRCDALYLSREQTPPPADYTAFAAERLRLLGHGDPQRVAGADLVVVGGGIAGCATALTAARYGLKVVLVDNLPWLGGNHALGVRANGLMFENLYPELGNITCQILNADITEKNNPEAYFVRENRTGYIKRYLPIPALRDYKGPPSELMTQAQENLSVSERQNITKSDNDRTSVGPSAISSLPEGMSQLCLSVIQPIVCLHASGGEVDFEIPPYKPGMNAGAPGVLFFGYDLQAGNVVERNTYGNELIETSQFTGNMTLELNREKILASWDKTEKVEQTIGVPFLCEIPILKYLFSTTTTETVKTRVYLTVRAELLNTGIPSAGIGKLRKLK